MKKYLHLTFFLFVSNFACAQSNSFTDYCKSKMHKDSLQMNTMQNNIGVGRNYKYHIVTLKQPNSIYRTTYYYPYLEKGLNKEVYRTNRIDTNIGNILGHRDSFNPHQSRDLRSTVVNTILGTIFKVN